MQLQCGEVQNCEGQSCKCTLANEPLIDEVWRFEEVSFLRA